MKSGSQTPEFKLCFQEVNGFQMCDNNKMLSSQRLNSSDLSKHDGYISVVTVLQSYVRKEPQREKEQEICTKNKKRKHGEKNERQSNIKNIYIDLAANNVQGIVSQNPEKANIFDWGLDHIENEVIFEAINFLNLKINVSLYLKFEQKKIIEIFSRSKLTANVII